MYSLSIHLMVVKHGKLLPVDGVHIVGSKINSEFISNDDNAGGAEAGMA